MMGGLSKPAAGDTVGLEGLLERRSVALGGCLWNDDAKSVGADLSEAERDRIAEAVGIAALKYADLSQNRTSDYVFSYEKMLAMNGNTATYMQYAHARERSIFAKGQVDVEALRRGGHAIELEAPAERALGLELLALEKRSRWDAADFRPNQLTSYLFDLANRYSTFFEECPVLRRKRLTATADCCSVISPPARCSRDSHCWGSKSSTRCRPPPHGPFTGRMSHARVSFSGARPRQAVAPGGHGLEAAKDHPAGAVCRTLVTVIFTTRLI